MEHNRAVSSRRASRIAAAVGAVSSAAALYALYIRPRMQRWGATEEESRGALSGDDLVVAPKLCVTHAITIHAPAGEVWPWLVQIGQGRGGFYSYDFIDNLMGLDIHTADRILPEFQNLQVGDKIPLAPDGFGVPVAVLEPQRALVLFGDTRLGPGAIPTLKVGDYFAVTWGWFLSEVDSHTTRLVERWRADWNPSLQQTLFMRAFLEPGAFLMERKMLLGIKERAERHRGPVIEQAPEAGAA